MKFKFIRTYLLICALLFLATGVGCAFAALFIVAKGPDLFLALPASIVSAGCLTAFAVIEVALALRERDHFNNDRR